MDRNKRLILNLLLWFSILMSSLYVYVRIFKNILNPVPSGDEGSFLKVFNIFVNSGFSEANIYGNSTIFNCIAYLFYLLGFDSLTSLKITSLSFAVLSIILLCFLIEKYFNYLPRLYKNGIMLTSVNAMIVMSFIFTGINDIFMTFFTVLFFFIFYRIKGEKGNENAILYLYMGFIFALMLSTRKVSVLIFPTFAFVLGIFFYNQKLSFKLIFYKSLKILISFLIGLLLFNYPSLKEKGTLSFHEKKIEQEDVSWPQLQYLSAIWLEEGRVKYGEHCKPKDVVAYISENGNQSLPNSILETITFNIPRTIRTYVRETTYLIKPYTRLLGGIFILGIFLFFRGILKKEINLQKIINNEIVIFFINYSLIIVLIICSYIEPRWLMPLIFLLPILFFSYLYSFLNKLNIGNKIEFLVFGIHFLLLGLMNIKFFINNYQFII
ncbi:hypothetical protein [Polaribacter atrinae]|uniref:hypothetical protein n=1 Tax=Polaribacter atrinae TaxID=1333662 RepID=UPI0030F6C068